MWPAANPSSVDDDDDEMHFSIQPNFFLIFLLYYFENLLDFLNPFKKKKLNGDARARSGERASNANETRTRRPSRLVGR